MAQINPAIPSLGEAEWGGKLNTALGQLVGQGNELDQVVRTGRLSQANLETAFDGIIDSPSREVRVNITSESGVDPSGADDSTAAMIAAVHSAPDGAEIRLKTGRYRMDGTVSLNNYVNGDVTGAIKKDFVLDGAGSTIVLEGGTAEFLRLIGAYGTTYNITSALTPTTVDTGNGNNTPAVQFTTDTAPTWARGDLVKVIAEDEAPGTRSPSYSAFADVSTTAASTSLSVADAPALPLAVGQAVRFPSGTTAYTPARDYYIVEVMSATTFRISTTLAGAAIAAATTQTITTTRATAFARNATTFRVWSISGNTVTVLGTIWGTYVRSPRVAAVNQYNVSIRNLNIEFSAERLATPSNAIRLTSLVGANIDNVRVPYAAGPVITLYDVYHSSVTRAYIGYDRNDQSNGFYGYGVLFNGGSAYNTVSTCFFGNLRHGTSDDVTDTSIGSGFSRYGVPTFNRVTDCVASSCSMSAFDTHHGSRGTQFSNLVIHASGGGVAIRGQEFSVSNITLYDCFIDINIFEEDSGRNGSSRGHSIRGITSYRNGKAVIQADKGGTGNWDGNVTRTRPDIVTDVHVYSPNGNVLYLLNSTMFAGSIYVHADRPFPGREWFLVNNSVLRIVGPVQVDATSLTAATNSGLVAFRTGGSVSTIDVRGPLHLVNVTGVPNRVFLTSSSAHRVLAQDVQLASLGGITPLDMTVTPHADTFVNYKSDGSGTSSTWFAVASNHTSASSYLPVRLTSLYDLHMTVSALAADTTVPPGTLPAPKMVGTRLSIYNGSGLYSITFEGITIASGATAMLIYVSGAGWRRVS